MSEKFHNPDQFSTSSVDKHVSKSDVLEVLDSEAKTRIDDGVDSLPNVENEAGKKKLTLVELFRLAGENIEETVNTLPEFGEKIVEELSSSLSASEKVAVDASSLFNDMAKNGLRVSDKEYSYILPGSYIKEKIEDLTRYIAEVAKHSSKLAYIRIKESVDSLFKTREPVRSEEYEGETLKQNFFQKFKQENSNNIITESVINGKLSQEVSIATAFLEFSNRDNSTVLDLGQLIPEGYCYAPSGYLGLSENNKEAKGALDLNEYKGAQYAEDAFRSLAYGVVGQTPLLLVEYGNLAKKGGMLSLLHEVAHAWQRMYHADSGRKNFEDFLTMAVGGYIDLLEKDKEASSTIIMLDLMREKGITISEEELDKPLPSWKSFIVKKQILRSLGNKDFLINLNFVIETNRLRSLIKDYVVEERDAWAHALRVLRFLRTQGFDLEPELKTSKDMQEVVHSALSTYQFVIDREVKAPDDIKKFTNKEYNITTNK